MTVERVAGAGVTITTAPPEALLRARIREDLPAETFTPQPLRALGAIPRVAVAVGGTVALIRVEMAWPFALLIALAIGQAYASLMFLGHETLHGSLVRTRWAQEILGYIGFAPFLMSPHLWRIWHNQVHHTKTNMGHTDPDGFETLERYQRMWPIRAVTRLTPGSGHWASYLYLTYYFTLHGQVVLWFRSKELDGFSGLNRRRAVLDTVAAVSAWIALAWVAGPLTSLFVIVIPLATANATTMGYIATNHFLRPQGDGGFRW